LYDRCGECFQDQPQPVYPGTHLGPTSQIPVPPQGRAYPCVLNH
jgi:hypothetical protein